MVSVPAHYGISSRAEPICQYTVIRSKNAPIAHPEQPEGRAAMAQIFRLPVRLFRPQDRTATESQPMQSRRPIWITIPPDSFDFALLGDNQSPDPSDAA